MFQAISLPVPSILAYLDPGSGSVLVSIVAALAAAAFYYTRSFFYEKARSLFKKESSLHKEHHGLVVYSEGGQYWHVFSPILAELTRRGQACTYLTSDSEDPGLRAGWENLRAIDIGQGHEAYFVLNRLSADLVLMTTPCLDVLQIKRSKKVKHYCHIVHSMEDTSTDPPFSVDYYDSVLVNGKHQEEVIRQLEEIRKTPAKRIDLIGSTYLDVLQEERDAPQAPETLDVPPGEGPAVLLAPSWGEKGFLSRFGGEILQILLDGGCRVIVRPHPQSFVSEAPMLEELQAQFSGQERVVWDKNKRGLEAMKKSDLMISDFSGVIFDYVFLFEKPVLLTDFAVDPRKYEMNALPDKSSTIMKLVGEGKIGRQFSGEEVSRLPQIITAALADGGFREGIREIKPRIWCCPGEAGKRGAEALMEILQEDSADTDQCRQ